ncbi:MAG: hypothetical protein ABSA74_02480, partial [Candidatus Staskawiczbacteria bacterium]
MQKKILKYFLIAAAIVFIVPQITLASWYNPFTWNWNVFNWFSKPQTGTVQPNKNINQSQPQNTIPPTP